MFRFLEKILSALAKEKNELYYINGSDTLPSPLTPDEEFEFLQKKDYDEKARAKLVEHNLRLVVYIAKKFESTGVGIEDLISIGTIGLIKSVNTFKCDRNIKLATYASRCIENEILMFIRKSSKERNDISIDEPLNVDWDGNELLLSDVLGGDADSVYRNIESEQDRMIITNAVSSLSPRDREIISLRFALDGGEELTQKEVADKLGISQSYISRLEKKIIEKLKKQIASQI